MTFVAAEKLRFETVQEVLAVIKESQNNWTLTTCEQARQAPWIVQTLRRLEVKD